MKSKDIARNFNLDPAAFDEWLTRSNYTTRVGLIMGGIDVDESQNITEIVGAFKEYQLSEQERIARENADNARVAQEKQQALASILVTSGFSFDGYTITKYSGYISGDDAIQVDRGAQGFFGGGVTDVGASLMASLTHIRRNALAELKEAALALGCNAVIGVDFDYLTLDPETVTSGGGVLYLPYVFGVTANGNAVIIQKNDPTGSS